MLWFLMLWNQVCLRFRCYEPVIVGGFMVTTLPDVIGIM